ncbi:MAG: hypothetical protein IKI77_06420, partial [Oscillospiraceae bacterium]|nr:hypothetical protein [Oscillospiraceae bacterium]
GLHGHPPHPRRGGQFLHPHRAGPDGRVPLRIRGGAKLCPSISEARRLVQQGGVTVNDEKVTDPKAQFTLENDLIVKKGKKVFHKVTKG